MRFLGPGGFSACLPHLFGTISFSVTAHAPRRARTYTCVSCHTHARREAGTGGKKGKPLDLLRFCRGRMKMKQQESGITRARSASSSFSRPYKISTASHQPGVQIHPARARLALAPCTANPRTPFSSPELSLQASPGLTSCRL